MSPSCYTGQPRARTLRGAGRRLWALLAVLACFAAVPATSHAGNQGRPGINLGLTSFFDGFGRPVDGFTYQAYLHYARARTFYDAQGVASTAFRDPQFDIFLLLNQLSYSFPATWFDGAVRPALNFILPVLAYQTSFGTPGPVLTSNSAGLGDLTFGPMFQFSPVIVDGRPVLSSRIELDLIVPTGKFNPGNNINQGTNYVSFNPYWAVSVLPLPGLEISLRFNWIYNFTNERPVNPPVDRTGAMPMPLPVESAQAGQAFWVNYAASYEIVKGLHVGASGYYYKQLTNDRFFLVGGAVTDGTAYGEGKQQVFGVGPGVYWEVAKTEKLFVNAVFPMALQARWDHSFYQLRWIHSF